MDVVLFVLFAGLQLALAGLGVFVSLKPQPPERHRGWIITFLLLAVLAIAVGVVQQVRSTHAQESLQGQLTDIKKKIVPPPTAEENAAAVVALQDKHAADNRQPSTSSRPKRTADKAASITPKNSRSFTRPKFFAIPPLLHRQKLLFLPSQLQDSQSVRVPALTHLLAKTLQLRPASWFKPIGTFPCFV